MGKPDGKRTLGRPRHRWEDNIKMDLREVGCDPRNCVFCCWVLRHFLISKVISVASDIEREKSDKFCSEALISA